MRPTPAFLLLLFLLLLKGHSDVYAGVRHHDAVLSTPRYIDKARQMNLEHSDIDLEIVKDTNQTEKRDEFVSIEDEDESPVFSRKYALLVKYFITLAYASILICFYQYFKNRLPFCRHLSYTSSYKYILQRVLRL